MRLQAWTVLQIDSQNVSDDSDGPHVTRCVILLRTQHFRSYKRREGTKGVHVDEGELGVYHKVMCRGVINSFEHTCTW